MHIRAGHVFAFVNHAADLKFQASLDYLHKTPLSLLLVC